MYKQINIDCGIKQKNTWFHILLAQINFFFHCYQPPATFSQQQWSCLEVQTQASGNSNVCLAMFWKTALQHLANSYKSPVCMNPYKSDDTVFHAKTPSL